MFVYTGYIFGCPGYSFYKIIFPYRAIGDLADRAGDRSAVVHMEIKLYGSIDVVNKKNNHLFHFIMGITETVIPRKCNMSINVKMRSELLDFHVVNIDPLCAAVFFQHSDDLI